MKNAAIFLIFTLMAMTSQGAFSQNLLIKDYKVPVTSAKSFLIDLNYNYATIGKEETANQGKMGTVYKTFYESLTYGRSLDLVWSRSQNKDTNDYSTDLDGRLKKFIWPDRRFFGSVNLNGAYFKGYDRPAFNVTVGAGFGRFINATALAKAVRIEDFLLASGQFYDDLPAETMIQLGQIIERQGEYKDRYGDVYKRFWYDDMTTSIKASQMLKGDEINAEGILRMDEVLFREKISDRFYGWDVTLGAKVELLTPEASIDRATPAADVTARYSRPISWRSQFNERFTINSPMGDNFFRTYNLTSASDFSYEVTNRIDFVLNYLLKSEKRSQEADVLTSNTVTILFLFFLENQVNFTTSIQLDKSSETKLRQNFVMTLNYRVF